MAVPQRGYDILGSPVNGRIQAQAEPWDGRSFRVTSSLADHIATNRGLGTDFGNGKCGDPVLAMASGTVYQRFITREGALVIRLDHTGGWTTGYAHLMAFAVNYGEAVSRGQVIGTLGKSGASACHLHADAVKDGVHSEIFDLLDQNQETTDVLKGTFIEGITNRRATVLGPTQFLADPTDNSGGVLATFEAGRKFDPLFAVKGVTLAGSDRWYAGFGQTAKGLELGYLHGSALSPMVPLEKVGGFTQAQLDAAAMDAKVAGAKAAAEATAKAASDFAASLPRP